MRTFFEELFRKEKRDIFPHFTTATDTQAMDAVFHAVRETIKKMRLEELALY